MNHETTGTVKIIFDEQTFGSGFNKREFVVTTTADKFPQELKFECVKDKTALIDQLSVGDTVNVSFDVNGREWNEKYFVNLAAYRIDVTAKGQPQGDDGKPFTAAPNGEADTLNEDVPF